jgi:hypothetical protein
VSPRQPAQPDQPKWFVARSVNERPLLSHAVEAYGDPETLCGIPLLGWSRSYLAHWIPGFSCKRCERIVAGIMLSAARRKNERALRRHLSSVPRSGHERTG